MARDNNFESTDEVLTYWGIERTTENEHIFFIDSIDEYFKKEKVLKIESLNHWISKMTPRFVLRATQHTDDGYVKRDELKSYVFKE